MDRSQIIAGLDIGTTKICMIVARRNEFGKIEVLGMGKAESVGVMRGVVANIDKTMNSIIQASRQAEEASGVNIRVVHVGIAGQHIKSHQHRGLLMREDSETEISEDDVQKLIYDMRKLVLGPGDKVIHVLPQEFIVDGEHEVKDPVGINGVRLEANFHIISGQVNAIKNIHKCIHKAGLDTTDVHLEPLASAASVLSDEEKEAGVALVDIGGGTTDIAIFQDGIIRHTAVIPFGGNIITEDIKEGLMVMKAQAEQLKIRFGSAMPLDQHENEIIAIPGIRGMDPKEISVKNLSYIIKARMEEIIEQVYYEIRSSGYEDKLIAGIVLTGGGSELQHLVQLVEFVTGIASRVGYPTEHLAKGFVEEIKNPMYATGIGLIIKGFEQLELDELPNDELEESMIEGDSSEPREKGMKPGFFESINRKISGWFQEDLELKDF